MDVFYWEDKEKQIDFLLNESQSQAKEIEGLRKTVKGIRAMCNGFLSQDGFGHYVIDADELDELLKDTTQPDKGGE
jgi:hypothetical protein